MGLLNYRIATKFDNGMNSGVKLNKDMHYLTLKFKLILVMGVGESAVRPYFYCDAPVLKALCVCDAKNAVILFLR